MRFEWDENKDRINKAKHGVSFETATRVRDDPHVWIYFDRFEDGEDRFHAVGIVGGLMLLTVVHTYRGDTEMEIVRIIGARRATRHEKGAHQNS
jgi:uncharacterized DUF497 family protein